MTEEMKKLIMFKEESLSDYEFDRRELKELFKIHNDGDYCKCGICDNQRRILSEMAEDAQQYEKEDRI